jgi:hypothetical protein
MNRGRSGEFVANGCKARSVRLGHVFFQLTRHTAAIRSGDGSGAIGRPSVDFFIAEHFGILVAQWTKNHAMMSKECNHGQTNGFLSSTLSACRKEASSRLSNQCTLHPQTARRIQKGLFLSLENYRGESKRGVGVFSQGIANDQEPTLIWADMIPYRPDTPNMNPSYSVILSGVMMG